MKRFIYELKLAFASLQRVPGFVAAVVVTLGLTLGALACIAALNQVLFLKPLPYPDQDRLVTIRGVFFNNGTPLMENIHSYSSAKALYEKGDALEQASLLKYELLSIDSLPKQPKVSALFVSPEYFTLTNAPLALGRHFDQNEAVSAPQLSAVISYLTWQQLFGGDPDILNQKVELNGRSYRIVGVTAADFSIPDIAPDGYGKAEIWLPWEFHSGSQEERQDWGSMIFEIGLIGKVKSEFSQSQATQMLSDTLNTDFVKGLTAPGQSIPYTMAVKLSTFETVIIGDSRETALLMLGAALTLLLIASSNVVNLMLSRTMQKHRQLTIRAIHGANIQHLMLVLFSEAVLLMMFVAVVSVAVAMVGFDVLRGLDSLQLPRLDELKLDGLVVLLIMVIAFGLAALFTLISVRTIHYSKLQSSIQSSGKGAGLQISATVRSALVASQIALVGLLLAANSSVLKQSLDTIYKPMGFVPDEVVLTEVDYVGPTLTPADVTTIKEQILQKLGADPRVELVSTATVDPTRIAEGGVASHNFGDENGINVMMSWISQDYFDVHRYELINGRTFSEAEVKGQAQVAIISKSLALSLYPDKDPSGMTIFHNNSNKPYVIIGVVKDLTLPGQATEAIGEELSRHRFYMPGLTTEGIPEWRFQIRTKAGQKLTVDELTPLLHQLDPKLRVWTFETMEQRRAELLMRELMAAKISIALAALSLFLAGVGIYGVLSYGTQLRKYELGVRMSIGASPATIVLLVLRSNATAVFIGAVLSLLLCIASYAVARQYFENAIHVQILPLFITLLLILLVAAVASYLPIRSVIKRWPIHALRT
jgi:predicted permease